jgi:Enoyl-(Acyl carrier protein) reductase
MPPLIRRSQSAVPRHAGEDGGHLGLGSHPTARHGSPRHGARPVTATIGNRTHNGGRSDAHPLPPRQVPGSLAGAVASTVFMLAPRCTGRSRSWPFPIGCSRVRPTVVKTLASELGPARPRSTGCCPSGSADRVRELDALRGDPDEVRARLSEHIPLRGYGEPEKFGWAAAFVLSPAASRIIGAMIPVDGVPSARSEHPVAGKAARTKVPGNLTAITSFRGNFCYQLAWRSVPPVRRAGGMLSRNPGE